MSRPDALAARDAWAEAVWSSQLPGLQRLVALSYADHAGNGLAEVWVVGARLLERTGISRDAAYRALRGLQDAGWMTMTSPAAQHRSARYALTYPSTMQVSASRTPQQSVSQTAAESSGPSPVLLDSSSCTSPDASCTSPDASCTSDVPDLSSYPSTHLARATPADDDPTAVDPSETGEGEGSAPIVVEVAALPDGDHLAGTGQMVSGGAPRPGTPPETTRSDVEQRPPLRGGHLAPIPAQTTAAVGPDPRRASVEQAARAARVADDVLDDVVTAALADEETRSPAGRLARDPSWVARLERDIRARRRADAGAHEEGLRRAGALECEHGVRDGLALTRAGELRCLECRIEARTGGRILQAVR